MAYPVTDIEKVYQDITHLLKRLGISYMMVGGLAVNYYGEPRVTRDVDLVLAITSENKAKFWQALENHRYEFHKEEVALLASLSNRFAVMDPSGQIRIDLWIPKTSHELRAFERKKWRTVGKRKICLITAEDLVLFKLVANRPHDLTDALWVLKRQKGKLDRRYLKLWADALLVGDRLKKLEK